MGQQATFALFNSRREVRRTVHALESMGFSTSDIFVLMPDRRGSHDWAYSARTQIENGAKIGAVSGAVIGVVMGLLVALNIVPFFGEALGESINASFMRQFATVFMITMAWFMAGAFAGALVGIGTPKPAAERYRRYVETGGILLSVRVRSPEEDRRAREILEISGGQDINSIEEGGGWRTIFTPSTDATKKVS